MIGEKVCKLQIQVMQEESLFSLASQWSDFGCNSFMQSPEWLISAWREFHRAQPDIDGSCFRGCNIYDSENVIVGGALWYRQTSQATHWWRMVGSGPICSDYVQMPCKPGLEAEIGTAVANWIDSQPRKSLAFPEAIEVDGYSPECPQWRAFFDQLVSMGWSLDSMEIEGTWRLDLPGNWQEYESLLSKPHRRKARRAKKMLDSGEASLMALRSVREIEQYWPVFVALHQKRRLFMGQEGCFADQHFQRFLKSAVLELADQNVAWISCVHVENEPIAMLLIFDWQGTSYLYQSGIDTDRLHQEPGHLVNVATIQACIDNQQQGFDFLRGDERYKHDWQAQRSRLCRTIAFPPGFTGRRIASARKLRRTIMNWVKNRTNDTTTEKI